MAKQARLSQAQVILLSQWMKDKKEGLAQLNLTYPEIAKMAISELGFPISPKSIPRLADMMGLTLSNHPSTKKKDKPQNIMARRLNAVRDHLCLLFQKCGEPTPPEIGLDW
jgi:hypothetical protein